jgi:hypothetical protein
VLQVSVVRGRMTFGTLAFEKAKLVFRRCQCGCGGSHRRIGDLDGSVDAAEGVC